ncbi:MAG: hypothetical protein HY540_04280 [Deltaproteobacteria bacterium]|nr:hypothetical protein [Deltaproteobacteria bacterium]
MPCNDITDLLHLSLNQDDRITAYSLQKRTCGAEVGEYSLLSHWMDNKSIDDILASEPEQVLESKSPKDDTEEFLYLKHFFAVRNCLESFTGKRPSSDKDSVSIDRVDCSDEGVDIQASLKVEALATQVKSCSGCRCRKKT